MNGRLWRFRHGGLAALLLALVLAVSFSGCGGSGKKTGLSGKGVVRSVLTRDGAGALHLRAAAPFPLGETAVSGAQVTAIGTGRTTTTDANGAFTLGEVPAGRQVLSLAAPGGAPVDRSVTVVGDATVVPGSGAVGRAAAYTAVTTALGARFPANTVFIAGSQNPLPAGVTVFPAMAQVNGIPDQSKAYVTPSAQWFFFVDPHSATFYDHPVLYLFVDAQTGAVTEKAANSYPLVNGVRLFYRQSDVAQTDDTLVVPTEAPTVPPGRAQSLPRPAARAVAVADRHDPDLPCTDPAALRDLPAASRDHVPCNNPQSYALLVQGGSEEAMDDSFDALEEALTDVQKVPAGNLYTIRPYANVDPLQDFNNKLNAIKAAARPCDTVYIFVIGHGYAGGAIDLTYNAGIWNLFKDTGTQTLTPDSFSVRDIKACHIHIYLDACNSGAFLPKLQEQLLPKVGLTATVITSTDAQHTGHMVNLSLQLHTKGLVFTTYFGANIGDVAQNGNPADMEAAFDAAKSNLQRNAGLPTIRGIFASRALNSAPQIWVRPKQPGESCSTGSNFQYAVQLQHPLQVAGHSFPVGATIGLSRIRGGRIGSPETGCTSLHLHTSDGILIDDADEPIPDPNHTGCGFGPLVLIPYP